MNDSDSSPTILRFKDENAFLSNFFQQTFMYRALRWPSAEHAYQAMKTTILREQERIRLEAPTPGDAKRMGQRVTLRPAWENRRIQFMKAIIDHKFVSHTPIAQLLVNTHPSVLIEGNTWGDKFWGQCDGEGENNLGIILMNRRQALIDLGMKTVKNS